MGAFPMCVIMHLRRSLWPHNVPYQRHSGLLVLLFLQVNGGKYASKYFAKLCHQLLRSGFTMREVVKGRWDAGWELVIR